MARNLKNKKTKKNFHPIEIPVGLKRSGICTYRSTYIPLVFIEPLHHGKVESLGSGKIFGDWMKVFGSELSLNSKK